MTNTWDSIDCTFQIFTDSKDQTPSVRFPNGSQHRFRPLHLETSVMNELHPGDSHLISLVQDPHSAWSLCWQAVFTSDKQTPWEYTPFSELQHCTNQLPQKFPLCPLSRPYVLGYKDSQTEWLGNGIILCSPGSTAHWNLCFFKLELVDSVTWCWVCAREKPGCEYYKGSGSTASWYAKCRHTIHVLQPQPLQSTGCLNGSQTFTLALQYVLATGLLARSCSGGAFIQCDTF